jgi:hypothetical protein
MEAACGELRLAVEDAGAQYPVTIDPTITQQAYLKASNTGANNQFGASVAVSGDTVVVGAPNEDSAAMGVNGDQSDNSATNAGAAYVFVLYNFSGFFQPVDNMPTVNVVNAGRSIPIKFSLSGNKGLNIFAAGYPASLPMACDGTPGEDIEETVTDGSSSLSYDAATDTYTYVWKTEKSWAGTCRQLVVKLNDGSEHVANFKFK